MAKYSVNMTTWMNITVEVDTDGMTAEQIREAAIAAAEDNAPGGICHQCAGYDQSWGRDEGDEFTVPDGEDGVVLLDA